MAGDWLKVRHDLDDDPHVLRIREMLGGPAIDIDLIVGKLRRLWKYADRHTVDGFLPLVTPEMLDRDIVAYTGLAAALIQVGWLEFSPQGAQIVRFEDHNGGSAKERALSGKRVSKHRKRKADESTDVTVDRYETVTREEKRREEDKTPLPPKGAAAAPLSAKPTLEEELIAAWNCCASFTPCKGLIGKRGRSLQARARNREWVSTWRQGLERAARSAFCCGHNDRGWRATIDWFLRPDTVTRLLEGAYDLSSPAQAGPSGPSLDDLARQAAQRRQALESSRSRQDDGPQPLSRLIPGLNGQATEGQEDTHAR